MNIKNVEVISLIYKSCDYLDLIASELKTKCTVEGWDVGIRIVANDATPEVLQRLEELDVNFTIYTDDTPDDYYLNRVYRCWNYAGATSTYDNICFVNSDMMFSEGWLENLLKHDLTKYIPCSRLIESGKMPSGAYGLGVDCGKHPNNLDREKFKEAAQQISIEGFLEGGLYMPCVLNTKTFTESGMYPEGNIYTDGPGTLNGNVVMSGDAWYFQQLKNTKGLTHITAFDSIVYHIQEGEKDA
tara:strand:- start:209 stop:937 length:729 start_codon:yes stop_codon:yes gene_type:complete